MKITEEQIEKEVYLDIRLTPQEIQNLKDFALLSNSFKVGQCTFNIGVCRDVPDFNEFDKNDPLNDIF
jgi:hypothetical protein